jgi:hypothetical protein
MNRREFVAAIGGTLAAPIAGCSGDDEDDELYEDDAGEYLLSASSVSGIFPGEYEKGDVRPPNGDPAGLASSAIVTFAPIGDGNGVELGVVVFETVADAETTYQDTRASDEIETQDEEIGDVAYSFSVSGTNGVVARVSNVMVQSTGDDTLEFHRERN